MTLHIETLLSVIKEHCDQSDRGATTAELKRYLGVPSTYNISSRLTDSFDAKWIKKVQSGLPSRIMYYKISALGRKRLNHYADRVQTIDAIKVGSPTRTSPMAGSLSGLSAVAGVIEENQVLERKLRLIRKQLIDLLEVDDNGTSESDNAAATEEGDS